MKTLTLVLQIKSTPSPEWEGGIYVVTKSLRAGGWREENPTTYVRDIMLKDEQADAPEKVDEAVMAEAFAGIRGMFKKWGQVNVEIMASLENDAYARYTLTYHFKDIEGQSCLHNFCRVV